MTDRIEQLNQDEAFEAWWDSDPQREMYFPESKGTARAAWHAAVASRPEAQTQFKAVGWWDGQNGKALWEHGKEPAHGAILFRPLPMNSGPTS